MMATSQKPDEGDFKTRAIWTLYLKALQVLRVFDELYSHLNESVGPEGGSYSIILNHVGHQHIVFYGFWGPERLMP